MTELTLQILNHIYSQLGINSYRLISIMSDKYLLSDMIAFEDLDGNAHQCKLWGVQIKSPQAKFRLIVGDLSTDQSNPEYCLVVHMENCPVYGAVVSYEDDRPDNATLLFSIKDNKWLPTNTYIQATFLAGMESLKDLSAGWEKLPDKSDLIGTIRSLISFHDEGLEAEES